MGKGGYGLTYQEVYEMENLTIEAKAIYGMLCSYAGSKATAYPSVDFICNKLKISRTRFYRHMNLLGITEDTNTWSGWKKLGYEVIHGSRALFGCSLIWGSKGDGAVYNARFFGKSQVQAIV